MSDPGENEFLHGLEVDVEAEITIAEASHPEDLAGTPVAEWRFDPADAERYEVGLRGLLGAVEAVEDAEKGRS
jgi:hypothetical protein